jgi:hypothetical protein
MAAVSVTIGEAQLGYVPFDPRPWGAHAKLAALVPSGSRVLDAGCSTGYLSERPGGRLVLSTPNIANWAIRLSLPAGSLRPTLFAYQWVPAAEPA